MRATAMIPCGLFVEDIRTDCFEEIRWVGRDSAAGGTRLWSVVRISSIASDSAAAIWPIALPPSTRYRPCSFLAAAALRDTYHLVGLRTRYPPEKHQPTYSAKESFEAILHYK